MKKHEAFPSKYIKTEDLDGRDVTVTIERVLEEIIKNDDVEVKKPVLYFQKSHRGLVLNLINWDTIAEAHGEESNDWTGKKITLYPTKTQFGNKTVPCIRVRSNGKASTKPEVPFDDEVPF